MCSHRPVNRKQDIVNAGSVEAGGCGDTAAVDEREVPRECLDSSLHAIAARSANLYEILRCGKAHQEFSVVA